MELSFNPMGPDDLDDLVGFLTGQEWPFHGRRRLDPAEVRRAFAEGAYRGTGCRTFWIEVAGEGRVGLVRLFDLEDETPVFDLRIHQDARGRGIGRRSLEWLTRFVFETWPQKRRIEGYTRRDNQAMRRVFLRCGYVKEAQHRRAWPDGRGGYHDAVGYGILREDWEQGEVTPLDWD